MFEICFIDESNLDHFKSFILPNALKLMEKKVPVMTLGAVDDGTACAAACGYIDGNSFEIISFYVAPAHRKKGIAKSLLTTICEMVRPFAKSVGVSFMISEPDHALMSDMLEGYGFKTLGEEGRNIFMTSFDKLGEGVLFEHDYGSDLLPSFSEVDITTLEKAQEQALLAGLPIPKDGFWGPSVDAECSTIFMKGSRLQAYIAIEAIPEGALMVSALGSCTDNAMITMKVIHDAVIKCQDSYPDDTPIYMQLLTETSQRLVKTLDSTLDRIDRRYELAL